MPPDRKTNDIAQDEYQFRIEVLTGIAELKKEVQLSNKQMGEQIGELFGRVNYVEVNGCAKAQTHTDHEQRLRDLEKSRVANSSSTQQIPAFSMPAVVGVPDAAVPPKEFWLGKLKWKNFGVAEILVMLMGIVFISMIILKHFDSLRLSRIEEIVARMSGESVTNMVARLTKQP